MAAAEMTQSEAPHRRQASFAQTARAVFWSFFGVRKRAGYEQDAQQLNPVHVILMGLAGAALFVAALIVIIKFVVLR
jgi:hypothetical protein